MILSLLLATIIVVPAIAIVGVSKIGEMAIGGEGTATHVANATFWNTYGAFGLTMVIPFALGGSVLTVLLILAVQKIGYKEEVK